MNSRSAEQIQTDAVAIWQAGLAAVRSDELVASHIRLERDILHLGDWSAPLNAFRRIAVVGGGKAGAGMAQGLERALGKTVSQIKGLHGQINVPADCVDADTSFLNLIPARPAGVNEPTEAGVQATQQILRIANSLDSEDLCICLLSGGGSALLPAPLPGISLADKQQVTRLLSSGGANIEELNVVRQHLSQIKAGGLARACTAGTLVTLIISDVLGDPLDIIASGPTVAQARASHQDALDILRRYPSQEVPAAVWDILEKPTTSNSPDSGCQVHNQIIGNNALAVDAAGLEAERRGYSHAMVAATELEGTAEDVGQHLAKLATRMRTTPGPDCLITGGEPVVQLAPADVRGLGGRNQQLVLAALAQLLADGGSSNPLEGIALLSGGTDGEDGPTDAAGAMITEKMTETHADLLAECKRHLDTNDAYPFFARGQALLKTGPTHTNVCDLRVVTVDRIQAT